MAHIVVKQSATILQLRQLHYWKLDALRPGEGGGGESRCQMRTMSAPSQ